MNQELKRQIAELRRMPVSQLRQKHLEVFGEPSRSGHREYLFRRVAWKLQALAEGDLTERIRRIRGQAAVLARHADLRVTPPREMKQAWEEECLAPGTPTPGNPGSPRISGGPTKGRILREGKLTAGADRRLPMPGVTLARLFKGRLYEVKVMPVGFEMEGRLYPTLSAVAKKITGAHWNGYLFFGLKSRTQGGVESRQGGQA